jgi:hypothetical protein
MLRTLRRRETRSDFSFTFGRTETPMNGSPMDTSPDILDFADIRLADVGRVGGKNASLNPDVAIATTIRVADAERQKSGVPLEGVSV